MKRELAGRARRRTLAGADARLPPGSLLRVPLVRHMLEDASTKLVPRAIDGAWRAKKVIPRGMAGFQPLFGEVLYPGTGVVSTWLTRTREDARTLNADDLLVNEVMFLVHDYLHAWAYNAVRLLAPPCTPGYGPLDESNLEDLAFLHLVTEAVATVGLDYWYLSTVAFNDVCDLGSTFTLLSVSFHERHIREYRRHDPSFEAQTPSFLRKLATFYCTGLFEGFGVSDLQQSPLLYSWLRHELHYGKRQREYVRAWLRFLGGVPPRAEDVDGRPVDMSAPWKPKLLDDLGAMLWEKVKEDVLHPLPAAPRRGRWATSPGGPVDFRFVNVNALTEDEIARAIAKPLAQPEHGIFLAQFVSSFPLEVLDAEEARLFRAAEAAKDLRALVALFRGKPRVKRRHPEPRDIFFLG